MDNFKRLQQKWYQKLRAEGFQDIEDKKVSKRPDTRYKRFMFPQKTLNFYLSLDEYLTTHQDIPMLHRHILERYSNGVKIIHISTEIEKEYEMVRAIIRKYKREVFGL